MAWHGWVAAASSRMDDPTRAFGPLPPSEDLPDRPSDIKFQPSPPPPSFEADVFASLQLLTSLGSIRDLDYLSAPLPI